MKKFFYYFILIFKSKKKFFLPQKKDILIFDKTGSQYFLKYFKKNQYTILCTRFEEINIYILLKIFLLGKFKFKDYLDFYIKAVKPKIVLTFVDNNPNFYKLDKKNFSKSIFIQNGIRSSLNDIFYYKKNLKIEENNVDYMLVANKFYGKKYSSFIKGQTISIGYFKNNLYKISKLKKKKEILIISIFRNYPDTKKIYKNISFKNFFSNDIFFYNWLNKFCKKKKIKINILTRAKDWKEYLIEKAYFKKFFPSSNIIFERKNPYKWIDRFEYVVTNDSTLGIENLARGGKTAFICNAPNIYPLNTRKFGFNENLKKNGPFWTWENKKEKFKKILNFLINSKRKNWQKFLKDVAVIDPNNKIFKYYIKKTLKD